jgi:hypothetical protein
MISVIQMKSIGSVSRPAIYSLVKNDIGRKKNGIARNPFQFVKSKVD